MGATSECRRIDQYGRGRDVSLCEREWRVFFASNGHYGFGGLDLYKVGNVAGKEVIIHLPAPLNSFADDFGIAFKPGTEDGLLTSGRSGRNVIFIVLVLYRNN